MKSKPDITIAGLPIGGLDRTTPETLRSFKTARVILDLSSHQRLLQKFCKEVVNLDKHYWTGELDEVVYTRIANIVVDEGAKGPGVVLVVDGHPGIYQDLSWDIYEMGKRRGLKVRMLPALSCIDMMIPFCGLRLDSNGLQIHEATSIVGLNTPINPFVDLLVMQIGWFGTSLLVDVAHSKKGRFAPLIKYLRQFYPRNHVAKLLKVPFSDKQRSGGITTRIGSLDKFHKSITTDMTLLVPARTDDDDVRINEVFLRRTEDRDHLASIAKTKKSKR